MLDILTIIPGKKRQTHSGWWSFNAICCHHRGHKADRRGRAGIIFTDDGSWSYSCFNCQFKCGISPGKHYSGNTKKLLGWCGLDDNHIDKLSFQNFTSRYDVKTDYINAPITFETRTLPPDSVPLDPGDHNNSKHVQYLQSRGLDPHSYGYYIRESGTERDLNSIIIPYYYQHKLVGYTCRFYDGRKPKYISEQQRGYVFNIDAVQRDWQVVILVEGQFDAISIGGCAYLGSTISDEQAQLLARLRKTVIVVPDHDVSGMNVCDRALELGYKVSIPDWPSHIKDVNDAVREWGKLPTLISILQCSTSSRITVEMNKRKYR